MTGGSMMSQSEMSGAEVAAIMRAMNEIPEPITQYEVRHRYMSDPMFHRRVDLAVEAMESAHGVRFDHHDMTLAIEAAGWALLVAERFP